MSSGTRARRASRRPKAALVVVAVVALLAVLAVAVVLLTGHDDGDTGAEATGPGGAQLDTYPVPDVDDLDKVGAKAKQTDVTSCAALAQGGWQAMGTVANDGDEERDYDITVFFMRGKKPVNFAQTSVTAPADTTVPWVTEKVFGTKDDLTCKLVAVG